MKRNLNKEIAQTIRRVAKGQKGTGRRYTRQEMSYLLHSYRRRTASVKENMEWEDYLNLIDIAVYVNPNNAVDLAWRIGYTEGKEGAKKERLRNISGRMVQRHDRL